jgi:hypothetical protein
MASTTSKRKETISFFLPEEKLNSPALPSQLLKLYRLITETDVALRQQCKCLSLAVLSIPRTAAAAADERQRRERAQRGSRCSAAAAASTGGRRRSKKECVKSN